MLMSNMISGLINQFFSNKSIQMSNEIQIFCYVFHFMILINTTIYFQFYWCDEANFWIRRFRDAWDSCTHKKAVALGIFGLVWNLSSVVARIWAGIYITCFIIWFVDIICIDMRRYNTYIMYIRSSYFAEIWLLIIILYLLFNKKTYIMYIY
jgi:hypothetical protein